MGTDEAKRKREQRDQRENGGEDGEVRGRGTRHVTLVTLRTRSLVGRTFALKD